MLLRITLLTLALLCTEAAQAQYSPQPYAPPPYYPPPRREVPPWGYAQNEDAQFIVNLYHDYLGREPGPQEVDAWLQRLDHLRGRRSKLVEEFQKAAQVELRQRAWQRYP